MAASTPFDDEISTRSTMSMARVTDAEGLLNAAGAGEVLGLLQRLGFWVGGRRAGEVGKQFSPNLSQLESGALGDEFGYWQSELSRVTAILGALSGQERLLRRDIKTTRDSAAAVHLRELTEKNEKVPTKAVLDLTVSERPEVIEAENRLAVLESVTITLTATKEAVEGYCRVLSRELTRRGDLLKAGIGPRR